MHDSSKTRRLFKNSFLLVCRSMGELLVSSFRFHVSCCQEATSKNLILETCNLKLLNEIRFTLDASWLLRTPLAGILNSLLATMRARYSSGILCLALTMLLVPAMPPFTQAQVIKSGPPSCPGVALTFDLCPVRKGAGYDQALIDYLIEQEIPATFFMSGKWMTKHDQQVQALLQIPFFEVGTHGEVHAHLPLHSVDEQKQEILGPVRLLKTKYGHDATLFRPPYGEFNDDTVNVARALGLQFILWNVVSGDPDPTLTAIRIEDRLKQLVRKGSVIVMHANGKGRHTYEVVQDLHQHLLPERNLTPMTMSDLLTCKQAAP